MGRENREMEIETDRDKDRNGKRGISQTQGDKEK